jgi:hypothetical protein
VFVVADVILLNASNPRKKAWAPWTAGTCINLKVMFLAVSVPNIITDIAILALPLPNVWALQTNLRQRVLLIIIFLLGTFLSLQVSTALRSTWITTRTICRVSSRRILLALTDAKILDTLALGCAWNAIKLSSGISQHVCQLW